MARTEICYGGESFTIVGTNAADVEREIEAILESGRPGWLRAYDGHGSSKLVGLLITPGIALTAVDMDETDLSAGTV